MHQRRAASRYRYLRRLPPASSDPPVSKDASPPCPKSKTNTHEVAQHHGQDTRQLIFDSSARADARHRYRIYSAARIGDAICRAANNTVAEPLLRPSDGTKPGRRVAARRRLNVRVDALKRQYSRAAVSAPSVRSVVTPRVIAADQCSTTSHEVVNIAAMPRRRAAASGTPRHEYVARTRCRVDGALSSAAHELRSAVAGRCRRLTYRPAVRRIDEFPSVRIRQRDGSSG